LELKYGGVKGIAKKLETDIVKGRSNSVCDDRTLLIDQDDLEARLSFFSKNYVEGKKPRGFFSILIGALKDKTLLILSGIRSMFHCITPSFQLLRLFLSF
jgi:hypothetical protein